MACAAFGASRYHFEVAVDGTVRGQDSFVVPEGGRRVAQFSWHQVESAAPSRCKPEPMPAAGGLSSGVCVRFAAIDFAGVKRVEVTLKRGGVVVGVSTTERTLPDGIVHLAFPAARTPGEYEVEVAADGISLGTARASLR